MIDTLYQRHVSPGGRVTYEPVASNGGFEFKPGAHLVVVTRGIATVTTVMYDVDPDHAGLLAAMVPLRDAMERAVVEAMRLKPGPEVSPAHAKAWAAYVAELNRHGASDTRLSFQGVSAVDVVEAGLAVVLKAVKP